MESAHPILDQKPDELSQVSRNLTSSPVDFRIRLEHPPREPEVIAVDNWRQVGPSHGSIDGLSQNVPGGPSFIVYERIALGPEG